MIKYRQRLCSKSRRIRARPSVLISGSACSNAVENSGNLERLALSTIKKYNTLHHNQEDFFLMSEHTALLIIDMQTTLFEVPDNPTYREAELLANISTLLQKARSTLTPIIYIQHQEKSGPLVVGTRTWQILPAIAPLEHELVVPKYAEDSFFATTLEDELRARNITHLVVCGCRSEFCVDTTCRSAISHGYEVTLVSDAHSTINRKVLNAELIVAHHNATLDGFGPEGRHIAVSPTCEIVFAY
jgi:nicotinamidase-related amidase